MGWLFKQFEFLIKTLALIANALGETNTIGLFHLIAVHPLWMNSEENLYPWTQLNGNHPPGQPLTRSLFPHNIIIIKSTITPPGYLRWRVSKIHCARK